jgi:hypothetical protein
MDGLGQWKRETEDALTVMGGSQAGQGHALRNGQHRYARWA